MDTRAWAHELKHDGYRLQIHVRDGRVKLYTMNGADWSKRYPLIVDAAAHIKGNAILDAEVVWIGPDGVADFDALHSRVNDKSASACAFDLLMVNGDDLRRRPYVERKAALRKLLRHGRCIQYVGSWRQIICRRMQTRAGRYCFQEARRALSLRVVEDLDQSQESEGTGCNPRHGWDVLGI